MAAWLDNVQFNPTAGGTTDWTYSSAVSGYQSPAAAGAVNGRNYKYFAIDSSNNWELGEGAWNTGTTVLSRTTIIANSLGTTAKINFASAPVVSVVAIKEDMISVEEANSFTASQQAQALANLGAPIIKPGGRLTLMSGQPVMQGNVTAASTVYYDTFESNVVWIFNGTNFVPLVITGDEISMGLSTANVISGNVYDVWAVNNAGALAIGIGPAWASTSSRGTGAGTSQLAFKSGIRTNAVSLTHVYGGVAGTTDYGPVAANQATLLGSFYANANGKLDMNLTPAAASGGTNNYLCLSNAYNRVEYAAACLDSKASWTYAATAWRQADASSNNQINLLDCIGTSLIDATYQCGVTTSATSGCQIGINRGSSTAAPPIQALAYATGSVAANVGPIAGGIFAPNLGLQTIVGCEVAYSATTQTFYGSGWGGSAGQTQGLIVKAYF